MAYATSDEAVELYGETYILSSIDRDKDGAVDATAFSSSLDKASNIVDSYLGVRYDVPISPTPEVLKQYTIDIAVYVSSPDLALTKEKRQRYEDAIAWLKLVGQGKASLGIDEPTEEQEHHIQSSSNTRQMTRSKLDGLL